MSQPTPSRSTLADVLAATQASGGTSHRRQDMASAVRTVAKVLGRNLSEIEANPRLLGIRLKSVSPIAMGMSDRRWNNVRSLFRAALRLIKPVMPGRDETPLLEAWAKLFAVIADRRSERIRLSRLVHWLSARQIAPDTMTYNDLEQFRLELTNEALLGNPEATWTDTVRAWNRAVKAVSGWPQLLIERVSRKEVYVMTWDKFPFSLKQDVDLWLDRLACRDFADDGPSKPVKSSTLATREYQLRSFASALVHRGRDAESLASLAACLTYDNFAEGLRFYFDRQGGKTTSTIHSLAAMLKGVARHWAKADQATLDRMTVAVGKLAVDQKGMTQKNRDRLRQLQDPEQELALLRLPLKLRDLVDRGKVPSHRRALLAQLADGADDPEGPCRQDETRTTRTRAEGQGGRRPRLWLSCR